MPELPDLVYITKNLEQSLIGKKITGAVVKKPIVIRMLFSGTFEENLTGESFVSVARKGPFLHFKLDTRDLVINLMLTGKLQLCSQKEKPVKALCFSILLEDNMVLHYGDDKQMGKVYLAPQESLDQIPGLLTQGTDILSDDFTLEFFLTRINKKRSQARVFIMDQTVISSIGNAYADEILFDAKIHPKTPCNKLDDEEKNRLYESICRVMRLGIKKIEESGQPIEVKIRDHMKVRNRKDTPCPECGTTIRRASVHGYDTFFCPQCQPVKGKSAIPW